MPLSITVNSPMPNASVPTSFAVNGTFESFTILLKRNGANPPEPPPPPQPPPPSQTPAPPPVTISVFVKKGASSFGPFAGTPNSPMPGQWTATATADVGEDYTIEAYVYQGNDSVVHIIEGVDVVAANPPVEIQEPAPGSFGLERVAANVPFSGRYNSNLGTEVRCVVCKLLRGTTTAFYGNGGTHKTTRYNIAKTRRISAPATLTPNAMNPAMSTWSVPGLNVPGNSVVFVLLLNAQGQVVSTTSSNRF